MKKKLTIQSGSSAFCGHWVIDFFDVLLQAPYNSWLHHKQHVDEDHEGVMLVRCPQCARVFRSELELSRHKKADHAKKRLGDGEYAADRDVTCDQCGVMMKVGSLFS